MDLTLLYLVLPIIAFLYAAVGHGGASGYLALMVLFSFPEDEMRSTALVLNLVVAAIAYFHFAKAGHFKLRTFLVFAIASIPMSFYGGGLTINATIFKVILGVFILLSVAKLSGSLDFLFKKTDYDKDSKKANFPLGLFVGGGIGFLSGLIGIGGGIILSPIIMLLKWGNAKEAAAVSALFIWVNSCSGLLGGYANNTLHINEHYLSMICLVLVGGFAGGFIGSQKLDNIKLRYLLSFVLIIAAIKLIFGA